MAICKRIVEAHGGEIKSKSEVGKGSVFTVAFPLEPNFPTKEENFYVATTELPQLASAVSPRQWHHHHR